MSKDKDCTTTNLFTTNDFIFDNLDDAINHLNKTEITELVNNYYSGEKVINLLTKYKINVKVAKLISLFPAVKSPMYCEHCNIRMITKLMSKSSIKPYDSDSNTRCPSCNHYVSGFCSCKGCLARSEAIRSEKKQKELSAYLRKYDYLVTLQESERVCETSLSLHEKIYLATLLRSCLNEKMNKIIDLSKNSTSLAPHINMVIELIDSLYLRKIIIPSIDNDPDNFFESDDGTLSFQRFDINYKLNIAPMDGDYSEMVRRLIYPDPRPFLEDVGFCYDMWRKIAFYESLQYLLFKMRTVGYSYNIGEKTHIVFKNLVDNFSVGQIYNIVHRSIAFSTEKYQSGSITKKHAQNMVISSCELYGQKAIANNWTLSNYARVKELPQSQISKVFFDSIIKISYCGFTVKPTPTFLDPSLL